MELLLYCKVVRHAIYMILGFDIGVIIFQYAVYYQSMGHLIHSVYYPDIMLC